MKKRKIDIVLDRDEELALARRVHIGLRYHVHTEHLLAVRRARQMTIVLIIVVAVCAVLAVVIPLPWFRIP
jgi:hypothetical protein